MIFVSWTFRFLTFCSSSIGDFSGDIYSKPVSRGCSHRCDEHQVDPDSHYPHDITSCQSGAREHNWRRNWRYICWSRLRLDFSYHRPDLCVLSMQTLYCSTDLQHCTANQNATRPSSSHWTSVELVQWLSQTDASEQPMNVGSSLARKSCRRLVINWRLPALHLLKSLIPSALVVDNNASHKNNFVYSCWIVFMF